MSTWSAPWTAEHYKTRSFSYESLHKMSKPCILIHEYVHFVQTSDNEVYAYNFQISNNVSLNTKIWHFSFWDTLNTLITLLRTAEFFSIQFSSTSVTCHKFVDLTSHALKATVFKMLKYLHFFYMEIKGTWKYLIFNTQWLHLHDHWTVQLLNSDDAF